MSTRVGETLDPSMTEQGCVEDMRKLAAYLGRGYANSIHVDSLAEDLEQEAVMSIIKCFRGGVTDRAVYGAAMRCGITDFLRTWYKSRSKAPQYDTVAFDGDYHGGSTTGSLWDAMPIVCHALDSLTPLQQEVFYRVYINGETGQEASRALRMHSTRLSTIKLRVDTIIKGALNGD